MKHRVIYYYDELNDDFGGTGISARRIGGDFPFVHDSLPWRICAFILYYLVALPIVFAVNRVWYGVRIKNRHVLKNLKNGFFLYGNHTQHFADATMPSLLAFPRKAYVVASPDAASINGVCWLVQMLGGLILPNELSGMRGFVKAVKRRCDEKQAVAIYPEAHIWPYYTGIRPFSSASFVYPVKNDLPAVAFVTTYRKRLFRKLPPALTVTLSEPFYRDPSLNERDARENLRGQVYGFMRRQAENNEVEHILYIKKEKETSQK